MPARDPAERRAIASIAALARSTREDNAERLAAANKAYRDSFRIRHECEMCKLTEIPQDLPPEEIERRGAAAFKLHMRRLALRRDRARRLADEHAADAAAADAELSDIASAS